ncbi:hypothetical protein MSAN_02406700 [Mycena sanguinolenta]|uniref:Uncharacterized protein n=1 Tax=Mycena sanguinolenta TaxID=230812 RepID=A0A8H6X3S3_9AGAR|nr:hypothetical protein MSAN_02406700 [Mycena sanguinolenta]
MSKLRLPLFLYFLFVSCQVVSASYSSSSSSIYTRDGNFSTLTSATFTFARPSSSHDPNFSNWVTVVCLDPQNMDVDECSMPGFWRCPNTDVSGILVRVSAYLANLLLGIVIMYDPNKASGGVWAQLLTVYSLLTSAMIAIYTTGLTRFHASMTLLLVLSPLSFALGVYAILGFFGRHHRLDSILSSRREHLVPRLAVIGFWLFAIAAVVITSTSSDTHFTPPPPCDTVLDKGRFAAAMYSLTSIPYVGVAFVVLEFVLLYEDRYTSKRVLGIVLIPLFLLGAALVVAVINSRGSLNAQVRMANLNSRSKRFWAYWKLFGARYPFLHFLRRVLHSHDILGHIKRIAFVQHGRQRIHDLVRSGPGCICRFTAFGPGFDDDPSAGWMGQQSSTHSADNGKSKGVHSHTLRIAGGKSRNGFIEELG